MAPLQQGNGWKAPAPHEPVKRRWDLHPLLILQQHELRDSLQQAHQTGQEERHRPPGQGVILAAGADQAGLHNLRDPVPHPHAQDHWQGAGRQRHDQQRPLLFRRQVLSKYLSPPDFQVAGQGLSLFSVAHSQPGPPSGVRRQIALPSKFFFSPGFLWTAPGETGIIIYGKYAFVKHCQGKRPSMRSSPARPLLALPEKSSPGICSHFPAFLRFLSKFVL